jgi:hypothetical protein
MFLSANVDYRSASCLSRLIPMGYPTLSGADTFARNGWILSSGMSGYFAPESVDTFPRNTHLGRDHREGSGRLGEAVRAELLKKRRLNKRKEQPAD